MQARLFFLNEDAKILDALRKSSDNALEELFYKNRRSVSSLVIRNNGTEDDAEDVLQESLIVLWERVQKGTFEYQAKLSTFIYATAKNIWFRKLARQRREIHSDGEAFEIPDGNSSPFEEMEENERVLAVEQAMENIGNPCRDILLLYYWEEQSMEEIAVKLGFANADTIKSKKYQCKKALEKLVKKALGGAQ